MKNLIFFALIGIILQSCGTADPKKIGSVNVISTRNIDVDNTVKYVKIKNCAGCDKKDKTKSRAITIEEAVDNVVRTAPGGEYLQNARLYLVEGQYFAVEGDIYGNELSKEKEELLQPFKIGDKISYRSWGDTYYGIIKGVDLKNKKALVSAKTKNAKNEIESYQKFDSLIKTE